MTDSYYRNRRAFEAGQSSWDNACPPDDDEDYTEEAEDADEPKDQRG